MEEGIQQREHVQQLIVASVNGDLETVTDLLQSGVDPNCKDKVSSFMIHALLLC